MSKRYKELVQQLEQCLEHNRLVIAAIDGPSGSGKTVLAEKLRQQFDANVFHMDDFFLRPEQRTKARLQEPGGNIDYERFKAEVLDWIGSGEPFAYQIYDCAVEQLTDYVHVLPRRLNIVEGVYSMHPALIDSYDIKIYLTVGRNVQLERIRLRSGERMLKRFVEEWIPLEDHYFQTFNPAKLADFVLDNN